VLWAGLLPRICDISSGLGSRRWEFADVVTDDAQCPEEHEGSRLHDTFIVGGAGQSDGLVENFHGVTPWYGETKTALSKMEKRRDNEDRENL
jgi:hypothetical protein